MEDNDIPKFRTYRGEIEFEGTLMNEKSGYTG